MATARRVALAALAVAALALAPAQAQQITPGLLDNLVSRIALYPDPLLAQVLTAATYYDQIPDAAAYADQHSYLQGDALAQAIQNDNPPWDPSVLALLPFPSMLDALARDMDWTQSLGEAVLESRDAVMDAVQRMRQRAQGYGYLRDCPQYRVVTDGPWVEIVPVYDPYWIYAPPQAGFSIGISFAARIPVNSFVTLGWRTPRLDWRAHTFIIDNHVWERSAANRTMYVHTYREPMAVRPTPHAERPAAERGQGYHETHEVKPNRSERVAPPKRRIRTASESRRPPSLAAPVSAGTSLRQDSGLPTEGLAKAGGPCRI